MSRFDFDKETSRAGTYSVQYEGTEKLFGVGGLEPFWIADMDIETPKAIAEAMKRRIDNRIFGYTKWQNPDFHHAVKYWWKRRFDIELEEEMISFAPSVMFTVGEIIRQYTNEGDGVILAMPSYNAFIGIVKGNDRKIMACPIEEGGGGYHFDFEQFEALCRQEDVKVYVHCNPHNPTGKVWTQEEMERIRNICLANDVFLISDEIHMDFVRPKGKFVSMAELMADEDPILVTTGLGKTFNLASIPHSYFLTRHSALRNRIIRNVSSRYGIGAANSLALTAIHAAYTECEAWVDELNEYLEGNFQLVEAYIDEHLSDWLEFRKPEATYLAWISFEKSGIDEETLHKALIDIGGIAVSPGRIYDVEKNRHFRFNVASNRKRIEDGLKRIHRTFLEIMETRGQ